MGKAWIIKVIWRIVYISCACSFCLFWIGVMRAPWSQHNPYRGMPYYDDNIHILWGEISDYLVCGNCLVLLYDDKNTIQYYDLSGKPLFSYEFYFRNNGRSHLHTDGSKVFLEDRMGNYYVFSNNGQFLEYITDELKKSSINNQIINKNEARKAKSGDVFELRGASIYNVSKDGIRKVVSRPFWMAVFQGNRTLVYTIVLAAIIVAKHFHDHG